MKTRIQRISSTAALMHILLDDIVRAKEALDAEGLNSSASRRAYVRAVFALVEATLWSLKQRLLKRSARNRSLLSDEERALLEEEAYDLRENGVPRRQVKFLPLLPNVRFTFNTYARVFKCPEPPQYSGRGWQAFREAQELRNRVTHPKTFADLSVSEADLRHTDDAQDWFLHSSSKLLGATRRARKYDEA